MMKNLRVDLTGAGFAGDMRHAQEIMKSLGIEYKLAVPQSIVDSWWFFNCTGDMESLPPYVDELPGNPADMVGYGLASPEAAEIIACTRCHNKEKT